MRRLSLIVAIALVAASSAFALDPKLALTQYVRDRWGTEDGLQTAVDTMAQSADGDLWLGTQEGIARFDGAQFVRFHAENTPAVTDNNVRVVVADPNGDVWFGTRDGLLHWRKGAFTRYTKREGLPSEIVRALCRTSDGSLWVGTRDGLAQMKHGRVVRVFGTADGLPMTHVTALAVGMNGSLWVGTRGGLARLNDGRATAFTAADGLASDAVRALFVDRDGSVWVGTNDRGLSHFDGRRFRNYSNAEGLLDAQIFAITRDSDGVLWVGTGNGLGRLANGRFTFLGEKAAIGVVGAIFEDREHNLWVGTVAGLVRLKNGTFKTFTPLEGLSDVVVYTVAGQGDRVLVGTNRGGLNVLRGDEVVAHYGKESGLPTHSILGLWPARDGSIWMGTPNGLSVLRNGKVTHLSEKDGLASSDATVVHQTSDGAIWVGGGNGLTRFKDGAVRQYGKKDGLADTIIAGIREDRQGRLWVSTYNGGISRFDGERFVTYGLQHGLPKKFVWTMNSDDDGRLWVAVFSGGLCRLSGDRFRCVTSANGLPTNTFIDFVDDGRGFFWLTTNRGVVRVSKAQLDDVIAGRSRTVAAETFGRSDGMAHAECMGGQRGAWRADDGRLWFPTANGVTVVDPARILRNPIPPRMRIDAITANGAAVDLAKSAQWPAGSGEVQIRYTGITLRDPEKLRFRYKLEGLDTNWVEAGTRRTAYYTNLPPGNYRFRVRAAIEHGQASADDAVLSFRLIPPFYRTRWFAVLMAVLSVLLIVAMVTLVQWARFAALKKREHALTVLVHERTRLLEEASRKTQLILESAAEGIFGLDVEGRTMFINPAGAEMLGWQPDDLIGQPMHPVVHPRFGDGKACPLCARAQSTAELRTRGGAWIPVDFTLSDVQAPHGQVAGMVVTFRDVAERLAVERMKDEFVASVSHELRTPLTSIRTALGLLAGGALGSTTPKGQRMLDIALSNSDRLMRLVNDILDVERMSTGRLELRRTVVDIADVMQHAVEAMQPMGERVGVTVSAQLFHARLYIDPDRIIQLLTNLVGNAVKFSPAGSEVRVSAETAQENIILHVTDQGRGIPPEKLPLVFDRFRQVDADDAVQKGGAGLGLAISLGIAKAHGGTITVQSEVGVGSVFSVQMPLTT